MKGNRQSFYPLLLILSAAILTNLLNQLIINKMLLHIIKTFITVVFLFLFGVSLNRNRRKKEAVIKKIVVVVVVILLLFMQLGYFYVPNVTDWFVFLGIDAFYTNMLYIFCGYLFAN